MFYCWKEIPNTDDQTKQLSHFPLNQSKNKCNPNFSFPSLCTGRMRTVLTVVQREREIYNTSDWPKIVFALVMAYLLFQPPTPAVARFSFLQCLETEPSRQSLLFLVFFSNKTFNFWKCLFFLRYVLNLGLKCTRKTFLSATTRYASKNEVFT